MNKGKDYEKMSVFEQVMEGLKEGFAHTRGEVTLKTTMLPAPPPPVERANIKDQAKPGR